MTRSYFLRNIVPVIVSEVGGETSLDELNVIVRSMATEYNVPGAQTIALA